MREVFYAIENWSTQKIPLALATVINTWGSSPRGVGSKMVISPDGDMVGSVSGGCVEGAVVAAGMEVIQQGKTRLLHFGVVDETAWEVGLACGGEIDVFVQPLNKEIFNHIRFSWEKDIPLVRIIVIKGAEDLIGQEYILTAEGGLNFKSMRKLDIDVEPLARQALSRGESGIAAVPGNDAETIEVFLDVISPGDELVIIGGVHIATFLVIFAKVLGYRTTVIDPRKKFGNQARFPQADQVIQAWPKDALANIQLSARTAVVVLSHDPKIDDPALDVALKSPAFYVGALGSQQTQEARKKRLLDTGLSEVDLSRIQGPIGLNLGGRSPAEIALSIITEIVLLKYKKSGEALEETRWERV